MGNYAPVADELSLKEQSSRSLHEKSFSNENLDSVRFDLDSERFKEEPQEGVEVSLDNSNGVNYPSSRKNGIISSCLAVKAIPRRRRIVIGLAILFGIILIASVSATASKKNDTYLESSEARDRLRADNGSSRFNNGGRGNGGGAGNGNGITQKNVQDLADQFVESQIQNFFLGQEVRIPPFSVLDPVEDLDRHDYQRPESSTPSRRLDPLTENKKVALPTNAWYQNMLRLGEDQEPTKDHRVYTIPYIIDAAGEFAGIRAHATRLYTTPIQVELQIDEPWGLTLGAMSDISLDFTTPELDKGYSVHEATDLGLTLQWDSYMKTTLVRGDPYVTMIYDMSEQAVSDGVLPTMHWILSTKELPIIDGSRTVDCLSEPVFTVERDLEVSFFNSNQRWIVFFSRPVELRCQNNAGRPTIFQVVEEESYDEDPILIIRGALIVSSSSEADDDEGFGESFANQLRASSDLFPGQSTSVLHSYNEENDVARISFDWDAQSMSESNPNSTSSRNGYEMIMFALPHHREILDGKISPTLCTTSMVGPVCLVEGNVWNMYENLPAVDFRAPRHPDPKYLPILAQALVDDISYQIPSNFQSGASDTYFSGKTIAKLARILLIAEEVKDLCDSESPEYVAACANLELPRDDEIEKALNQLRDSVTVWVRTNAKAPFVYDRAWGGLVNCGCLYNGGECTNVFPDCPAFNDQGLNFGNAFYNDHHFHYGYHVYAAAALAHFDSAWAVELYEDVALLVRDYANPSDEDTSFPVFRNKDWYRGHSWAGGITNPMFRNLLNQESASEAIMAYEAVALFGKTMTSIFQDEGDFDKAYVADMMHKIGLTLTATEIRSTQKYWQVRQDAQDTERIYPEAYKASVVGIIWETFAQFTTWFGNAPYLIYGIQLLPITPIAEARDDIEWANEIYGPLSQSCNGLCVSEGWSIQVNAILATIGRVQEAVEGILSVPSSAYEYAGGNGHSKSNALWYISTRPGIGIPSFENEGDDLIKIDDETIEIEEEDSNATAGDDPQSDISVGDDFLAEFDDVFEIIEDEILEENGDSESNDNNIFDEFPSFNFDTDLNVIDDTIESDDSDNADPGSDGDDDGDGDDKFDGDNFDNDDFIDDDDGTELNCFSPLQCTPKILNTDAAGYTCGDRIQYLMIVRDKSEADACHEVSVDEFPEECGLCRPNI